MTIDRKFKEKSQIIPFDSLGFIWIFILMATIAIGVQYFCEKDHDARSKNKVNTVIQK
jgi:hypothetical protein